MNTLTKVKNYFVISAAMILVAFLIFVGIKINQVHQQVQISIVQYEETIESYQNLAAIAKEFAEETLYHQLENIKLYTFDSKDSLKQQTRIKVLDIYNNTMKQFFSKGYKRIK